MVHWKNANEVDVKYFKVVNFFLEKDKKLLNFLFDLNLPKLRCSELKLIQEANVLSSSEQVLISMAIDLWSGTSYTKLTSALNKVGVDKMIRFFKAYKNIYN